MTATKSHENAQKGELAGIQAPLAAPEFPQAFALETAGKVELMSAPPLPLFLRGSIRPFSCLLVILRGDNSGSDKL